MATAKSDSWHFRVAAVRLGGEVYRMIFAARALSEATDRKFLASIETFRKLSQEDTARLKPMRIHVVLASAGDSIDTMSARMVVADRPAEHFRLLNGLEKSEAIKPGERYKIVAE